MAAAGEPLASPRVVAAVVSPREEVLAAADGHTILVFDATVAAVCEPLAPPRVGAAESLSLGTLT